jgi:hypothetical protein
MPEGYRSSMGLCQRPETRAIRRKLDQEFRKKDSYESIVSKTLPKKERRLYREAEEGETPKRMAKVLT